MQINKAKTAPVIIMVLLMASMAFITTVLAQDVGGTHGGFGTMGTSPTNIYGYPKLGDLPSGVTPDYILDKTAFLSFRPNPIGVGQSLLVNMWTQPGTHHAFYMQGYKVTIEKPDGTTDSVTMNSYVADATAWFEYVPDQPGTYRLKFESPGTYIPKGVYVDRPGMLTSGNYTLSYSVYYKHCSTDWQELTVQADMVASWPPSPLPTDYWTRPANVINREWSPILGNYPFTGGAYYYPGGRVLYASNYQYTAYVQGPNSAHVVWKRLNPVTLSGMIGGQAWDYSMASSPGTPSMIFAGRCYQSVTKIVDGQSTSVWQCYDLRTGEMYWERMNVTQVPTMIEYSPPTPDPTVAGAGASRGWGISLMFIGGGRLIKYNPANGAMTVNVSISPLTTGTYYMPEYALTVQTLGSGANTTYRLINWTTAGSTTNFTARIMNNITWPQSSLGSLNDYDAGLSCAAGLNTEWPPEVESGTQPGSVGYNWVIGYRIISIDMKTGQRIVYIKSDDTLENAASQSSVADRGKVAYGASDCRWICYDARTGKKLWISEKTTYPWGWAFPYARASYDFNETKGAIITSTYEGVYAIDWDNGKIIWRYGTDTDNVPFEGPYDATPFFTAVTIADGKVYAFNGEHSASLPRDRAWSLHCINATTGERIWKILNPMEPGAVADGYLTASNPYDGYMYVFGRGKSATTVTAPDAAVPLGTAFTIKGTVLDQSPGQAGTPCVAKDSMSTQMEYLHLQMPIDGLWHNETITGVPVTLTAIGSDGSVTDLGSVTSNGYYGTFSKAWTPTKEDTYTIIASFAADDSYGSSNAATAVTVGPAPEPFPTIPEAQTPPDYTMTIIGMGIAVIIAVAMVGALLLLKRR